MSGRFRSSCSQRVPRLRRIFASTPFTDRAVFSRKHSTWATRNSLVHTRQLRVPKVREALPERLPFIVRGASRRVLGVLAACRLNFVTGTVTRKRPLHFPSVFFFVRAPSQPAISPLTTRQCSMKSLQNVSSNHLPRIKRAADVWNRYRIHGLFFFFE